MKAACATLVACVLLAAQVQAEESIDKRLPADPTGEVEVSNVAGTVSVAGWDRNEVQVTGNLGSRVEELQFESDRKRTTIVVKLKKGHYYGGDADTELSIRVPKGSRLSVNAVSAEISAVDLTGPQRLQSVSGDISSEITGEDAEIKTVSGNVSLRGDGKPGVLTLTTVSGDARVTRAAGEITANTVSGSLELGVDKLTRGRMRTTSGDLNFSGSLAPDARVDVESISGQLTLDFKGSVDAQIDIESFSGEIDSCSGPEAQRTQKYGPGSELHFAEGKGGGRVRVSSLSGDIKICTR